MVAWVGWLPLARPSPRLPASTHLLGRGLSHDHRGSEPQQPPDFDPTDASVDLVVDAAAVPAAAAVGPAAATVAAAAAVMAISAVRLA